MPKKYAEVRDDAIHPDFAPGGVAHRVGHLLRQVAAGEREYPVSGEHATVALVHGPEATDFAKFGEALHSEGHPLAGEFNWQHVSRGITADKAVLGYLRTNGMEPHQLFNHLNMHDHAFHNRSDLLRHIRKYLPDASHGTIDQVSQRMLFPRADDRRIAAHRYARVPDAEVHEHLRGLRIGSVLQKLAGEHTPGHEPAGHSAIAEAILRGDPSHLNFSALADALEERGHPLARAFNWRAAGPKIELDTKVRDTLRRHGMREQGAFHFLNERQLESNGGMLPDAVYDELHGLANGKHLHDSLFRVSNNNWERQDVTHPTYGGVHDYGHPHALPRSTDPSFYRRRYAMRAPKGGMIDRGVYYPGGEILPDWGTPHKASAVPQGVYTDPRTGAKFRHDAKSKKIVPA